MPQQALQIDQTGSYVLVVDKDNKIQIRRVELENVRTRTPSFARDWRPARGLSSKEFSGCARGRWLRRPKQDGGRSA